MKSTSKIAVNPSLVAAQEHLAGMQAPDWIQRHRAAAQERVATFGLPTRQDEDWKYTSTAALGTTHFAVPTSIERVAPHVAGDEWELVFVDGILASKLTPEFPGITLLPLAEACASSTFGDMAQRAISAGDRMHTDAITALNGAFLGNGVFIHVAPNVVSPKALYVTHLVDQQKTQACFPHHVIHLEKHAELRVIVTTRNLSATGPASDASLTSAVIDVSLSAGARCHIASLQQAVIATQQIDYVRAEVGRGAYLETFSFVPGGKLNRSNIHIDLAAKDARAHLYGLYLGDDKEVVDQQTSVQHSVSHTASEQFYRGIVAGQSRGIFNGKVNVAAGVRKIEAHQLNNNLLLSEDAEVDTKPQLVVDADDVKCSHGATVGPLLASELFYLASRGIDEVQARQFLSEAFAGHVVKSSTWPELSTRLSEELKRYFHLHRKGRDEGRAL